ncbi:APC membrane recruitment protein 2 [Trichomycterus rosablanca]|uniref:APC membrane recruitment protein 2 n=1 Tax=Trichomycterus rosablanca TaxID=2290929 RepID=UPI002F356D4A
MEVCIDPPRCDPQPSGRINKAAFKLFGKRRSGGGMPSIFSIRNKEDPGSDELARSKTYDGLTTDSEGHNKEERVSSEHLSGDAVEGITAAPVCSAITKSFSFFSLLRRNSTRITDRAATLGQRSRGLKGWFSSLRWRRKPPPRDESAEIQYIAKGMKGVDLILSCSSNSVEVLEENVTLTLEPLPQTFGGQTSDNSESWTGTSSQELQDNSGECTTRRSSSPLVQQVGEESPGLSPVRVLQSSEPLRATHNTPAHVTSIPGSTLTPPLEHSSADPPSEERLSAMFTDVTSLKSFDSLTGCGDIIADQEDDSGNGGSITSNGTGRPAKTPQGSGIVAYMGGGEEMASPEGVDDADMQGLWHMLPQKGEDSPALPRSDPVLPHLPTRQEKRPPQVKGLGLSKIPTSGRSGKQQQSTRPSPSPIDKDLQDVPPNDEGYWDSPTPGPEDENSGILQRVGMPKESCSGDALYDLYDLDSPGTVDSDDDDITMISPTPSTGDLKMSPPSQKSSTAASPSYHSIKGSTSLPRDSKIPIIVRPKPPPHSSSQGELSSPVSPTSHNPPSKANTPTRTRIPVSRVPVRSSGNKSSKVTPNKK